MSTEPTGSTTTLVRRFEYVDERTLRGADSGLHDVLDAVAELPWVRQWCPFMPHEYAILGKSPEQSWYVVEAMIRLSPSAYRAFFRGYQSANRYWEAPDGRRYWRSRFEIDRWDAADRSGLRRRDEGARAVKDWDGPPWAPNGSGLYERDAGGGWWPTKAALDAGYLPCASCQKTARKKTIVATPTEPGRSLAAIKQAHADSLEEQARGLTRDELAQVVRSIRDATSNPMRALPTPRDPPQASTTPSVSPEIRGVIERLLDLREEAAPLGDSTYRGPFTQIVIAKIAGVPVKTVTAMAIDRDRRRNADDEPDRA
jgi:hypothetical protein